MREDGGFQPPYLYHNNHHHHHAGVPPLHNGVCEVSSPLKPPPGGGGGPGSMFRDQLATVGAWFERWNECERTVALYSLLKKVPPAHARFLALVLEQTLAAAGPELQALEEEANNPAYLQRLSGKSKERAVADLLAHLPLLRPGNEAAARHYLGLIPRVLAHSIEHAQHIEESRQLLSYSLIHPAVTPADRRGLTLWLRHLEDRIHNNNNNGHHWHSAATLQAQQHSPPPPSAVTAATNVISPAENSSSIPQSPGGSWSPPHSPLSPQNSNSGGEGGGASLAGDDKSLFQGPGMKEVPSWLKSLRLHKYAHLFADLTYEDMMELTEEQLESKGVTKGARHKIVLSIQKLKSRHAVLQNFEKELQQESANIRPILSELKSMLQGPMKADPQEDGLPAQFTRLMGKICSNLLVTPRPDEDNVNLFLMLIEKCLSHEAFCPVQKRRLYSWKQQVQKSWHPLPARRTLETRSHRGWHLQESPPAHLLHPPSSPLSTVIKRPSLQDHHKPHVLIQRTHSAPVRPLAWLPPEGTGNGDPDITTRLESLCLSVTEHALADGSFYQD